MTGAEIQKLVQQNEELAIIARRLHSNCYGVGVQHANGDYAGPVTVPENDQPLEFTSLDQVVDFLSQVGIKTFQVSI